MRNMETNTNRITLKVDLLLAQADIPTVVLLNFRSKLYFLQREAPLDTVQILSK